MGTIRAAVTTLVLICSLHALALAQTTSANPCPPKIKGMEENYKPEFFLNVEVDCYNPPFWFRVGDQIWKEVVPTPVKDNDSGFLLSIPHSSADHFILIATGDCKSFPSDPSKCTPVALMVRTAVEQPKEKPALNTKDAPTTNNSPPTKDDSAKDAAAKDAQTSADAQTPMESTPFWHQLLSWDSEAKAYKITQDFKGFFQDKPQLRVVINGNIPVVGELPMPTPGKEPKPNESKNGKDQADKEALARKIKAENRSWAGKLLDPESDLNVRIYSIPDGCRNYIPDDQTPKQPIDQINIPAANRVLDQSDENGIALGGPKIFDTFVLKQKLATTVSQLATINSFSQAQLTAQVGTLQGITRDTSFFAAQLTTSPTPGISSIANSATDQTVTTTAPSGTSTQTISNACPAGFIPTPVTGSTSFTCVAGTGTSALPTQTTTTVNPLTNQVVTTATQPTQQVTTTIPSLTGTVPAAPTLNPLSPPSNIGQSASGTLDEQTRLNAQLITLQMLLQGASSDQLLLTHGRAIGERAQTTLGFPISVDTPQQYKGAVAEIRILILPRRGQTVTSQPVSIVNLLPSEKIYNVAKVTSKANQFGAGVALQLVSFGFNTGKSKDRLYLAKDTDTVALQYPVAAGLSGLSLPDLPSDECGNLPTAEDKFNPSGRYYFTSAVMFGWQYRPVLGASTVAPGVRTGFAQLALPQSDALAFDPEVWIQTRWRKYDQKKQIVGSVREESCRWRKLPDPVSIINPIVVKDVRVTDEGGGLLRFHATGDFFSSTGQVRSGSLSAPPQYFDGYSLEFFKAATDLLATGDLELLDEAMHGYPLVTPVKNPQACRITNPSLYALPRADGTSLMELKYDRSNYQPDRDKDGPQHPLVLIGSNVYGLRDKPFQPTDDRVLIDSACEHPSGDTAAHCRFKFVAKTDDIASAQNFLLRDPAWDSEGVTGSIRIDPTFTKIEAVAKPATKDDSGGADDFIPGCTTCQEKREAQRKAKEAAAKKAKEPKKPTPPTWFLLSGTNLSLLESAETSNSDAPVNYCNCEKGCLQVLEDTTNGVKPVVATNIKVASDSKVWLKLDEPAAVHVFWSRPDHQTSEWELSLKEDKTAVTGDPAVPYETDSRAVTFTGADFSKVTAVTFETTPLAIPVPVTKGKLVVQVTSAVTAKFGHKELLALAGADDNGKPKYIVLPFDVVKH